MNGWTLAALVLGYVIGLISGARVERRRAMALVEDLRRTTIEQLRQLRLVIAMKHHQDPANQQDGRRDKPTH